MAGDASGPEGARPTTGPGGLGIRINSVDQGVRDNVNFNDTPGVAWTAADQPAPAPARMTVTARLSAEIRLAYVTGVDLVPGGALQTLISAIAQTRLQVSRIFVIAENVGTVSVQPVVEFGTDTSGNPPNNDMVASGALALTATDQIQELTLLATRPTIDQSAPNDVLRMRQTGAATAASYVVGILVLGSVITP